MKALKSLFLLCAGLSFCACSSDNDGQFPEGKGAITIKVALPNTRAEIAPTGGDEGTDVVGLEGTIYVALTTTSGTIVKPIEENNAVTFYGIDTPQKVEAYVNGGKYVYLNKPAIDSSSNSDSNITDGDDNYNMQAEATKVPAYGFVETFTETDRSELFNGTSYKMFEAYVTMEILVARVEYTVTYDFKNSKFKNLDFQGAYLDNIKKTPSATEYDYRHNLDNPDDATAEYKSTATGDAAILYDYKTLSMENAAGSLPEASKVYAYNIYPYSVPHFKLWFNGATSDSDYVVPYQYAVVNSYNSGDLTSFEAGVIYRVTGLALTQENLATKEDGTLAGIEYGIDVTVTPAKWDISDVNGSWTQGGGNQN